MVSHAAMVIIAVTQYYWTIEVEAALRDVGVAYRIEGSAAVYGSAEVRHLLLTLRA